MHPHWHPARHRHLPHTGEEPAEARGRRRAWRSPPTPEDRALREARRRANRKIGFLAHLVPYAAVCLFLLFVAGFRAAMAVGMAWGIVVAVHYFFALVAPDLRRRFIEQEVRQRVQAGVSAERRSLAGRHAQSLEALSASIAHEIRNPITAAKSLVQQMGEDPAANDNVEYARVALQELERVERSVSHLLRFAREEQISPAELRLGTIVDSAVEALRERLAALGVRLERDLHGAGPLRGDAEKLRRVLLNMLGNALDAFEEAGTEGPRIALHAGENLAGTEVWLRVRDNGPGIPAERLERIWNPFYTSKSTGTGLGLSICKKIVEGHGGSMEVRSDPATGTEFLLTLPKGGPSEGMRP
jgi:signal transduction histidine kinase